MPGIDTDLEPLPARLAAILIIAAERLEAQAAEAGATPEALARGVGAIARAGAALHAMAERGARRRARLHDEDATEEAEMDGADPGGLEGPDPCDAADDEHVERGLRNLARNLWPAGALEDGAGRPPPGDPGEPDGQLARPGLGRPAAA